MKKLLKSVKLIFLTEKKLISHSYNLKNRFLFFFDTFHQIKKSEKNIEYNMSYDSSTEFFKKWTLF